MKKISIIILSLLIGLALHAQKGGVAPLAKGDLQVNFGTGFSDHGLPVYGSLDIAVHKDVTITPEVHIKFDEDVRGGALFKADYHWNYLIGIPNNWDFYSGARVGLDFGDDLEPDFGIQVGGRWYWSERWGLNLELAGGAGYGATFGLSVKL